MPLWESGVVRASANTAGHRTEPRTRGGRTGNRKGTGDNRTRHLGQGRYGRTEVEKNRTKERGKEATGKVGENTTALLRQGKRIPCQLTRP